MDNVNLSDKDGSCAIARQHLLADLNLVLSDVDALIRATADQRGAEITKVRAKVADTVARMRARIAEAEVGLLNKSMQASKIADDYLQENPWRNLSVATVVGLLIGLLIGRR